MAHTSKRKLRFKVVHAASFDEENPPYELESHSVHTPGWISARFCSYPQEIVLRFEGVVHIRQLQFLSHQFCIAKRVEIFHGPAISTDKYALPFKSSLVSWTRIGHFSLDPNHRSEYRARELKSVDLDLSCVYLRLILHSCHINKCNLYSQVGIVALNFVGEVVTPLDDPVTAEIEKAPPVDKSLQRMKPPREITQTEDIKFDMAFDALSADRIRELYEFKDKAVSVEDYAEAKRIKLAIDQLTEVGVEIGRLEQRKLDAVRREDYDTAHALKEHIEELRKECHFQSKFDAPASLEQSQSLPRAAPPTNAPAPYPNSTQEGGDRGSEAQLSARKQEAKQPEKTEQAEQLVVVGGGEEEQGRYPPVRAEVVVASSPPVPAAVSRDPTPRQVPPPRRMPTPEVAVPFDEQVIPTAAAVDPLLQSRPIQPANAGMPTEYPEGDEGNDTEAEPLSKANMKQAAPVVETFDELLARKLFSRHWNLRQEALETMLQRLEQVDLSSDAHRLGCIAVLEQVTKDRNAQVFEQGGDFLMAFLPLYADSGIHSQEAQLKLDGTIRALVERASESNARICNAAHDALLYIASEKKVHGLHGVASAAMEPLKNPNLWSKMLGKLRVVETLVGKFGVDGGTSHRQGGGLPGDLSAQTVGSFVKPSLESSNADCRKVAAALMSEVLRASPGLQGEMLKNVRANIAKSIVESLGGGGGGKVREESPLPSHANSRKERDHRDHSPPRRKPPPAGKAGRKAPPAVVSESEEDGEDNGGEYVVASRLGASRIGTSSGSGKEININVNIMSNGQAQIATGEMAPTRANSQVPQLEAEEEVGSDGEPSFIAEETPAWTCQFCGRYDKAFTDEVLDVHFVTDCPMLTVCAACEQVVEIPELNHHQLEECDMAEKFRKCGRCKEAIAAQSFREHELKRACIPSKPLHQASRCPLCHHDIPPGVDGWYQHIQEGTGCPQNSRTSKPKKPVRRKK